MTSTIYSDLQPAVLTTTELSELVVVHPDLVLFFEHFGLYLPFQYLTLSQFCTEQGMNPELVATLANLYLNHHLSLNYVADLNDLPVMMAYLKHCHRYYLDEIYPEIMLLIEEIQKHNNSEEIRLVEKFFIEYFQEVKEHLDYENNMVFPYMTDLYNSVIHPEYQLKDMDFSVTEYKDHHNDIEEKLDDLMSLLLKYLPNREDQIIRRRLFLKLVELNNDLSIHSKIEDWMLIPLVEWLEKQKK